MAFLNIAHGVVKRPTMPAVCTTVWESEESDMMKSLDACDGCQLHGNLCLHSCLAGFQYWNMNNRAWWKPDALVKTKATNTQSASLALPLLTLDGRSHLQKEGFGSLVKN